MRLSHKAAIHFNVWLAHLAAIVGDDLDVLTVRRKWQAGWTPGRTAQWLVS